MDPAPPSPALPPAAAEVPPRLESLTPEPPALAPPASSEPATPEPPKEELPNGGHAGADDDARREAAFRFRARLMAGIEYERKRPSGAQTRPASKEYGFLVKQVRLGVSGELSERLRINASLDLADALDPETGTAYSSPAYIRTATLEYRWSRALRLTVGRFKRPFSQLELVSAADLPVLNRGLFNGLAIEDNQWGDRAIGAMLSGRVKAPKLRWYLSLTNPGWSSSLDIQGVDVLGRVELAVSKLLSLAINGGYKYLDFSNQTTHAGAIGGDVELALGGAHLLLEANYADLPFETDRPHGLGALALFDYLLPLTVDWALQPTFLTEFADSNAKVSGSESLRLVLGLNVVAFERFRVMPQVALVRSLGDASQANPWLDSETISLILSLVL